MGHIAKVLLAREEKLRRQDEMPGAGSHVGSRCRGECVRGGGGGGGGELRRRIALPLTGGLERAVGVQGAGLDVKT